MELEKIVSPSCASTYSSKRPFTSLCGIKIVSLPFFIRLLSLSLSCDMAEQGSGAWKKDHLAAQGSGHSIWRIWGRVCECEA